ncbi:unnamed protein product [Coccothraustes coccothraustes]
MSPRPLPSTPHGPRERPIARSGAAIASPEENPRRPRLGSTSEEGSRSRDEPFSLFSPLIPPPHLAPMPALLRSLPGGGPGPTRGVQGIEAPLPLGEPKYPRCGRAGQQQQQR